MANELLDFVMSVVKNPDVAAAYTADPSQAIADAQLDGVTAADVNSLIPMVSESLSTGVASDAGVGGGLDANVWTSGAADAAFDAFGDLGDLPQQAVAEVHDLGGPVIDQVGSLPDVPDTASLDVPLIDDAPLLEHAPVGDLLEVPESGLDFAAESGTSGFAGPDQLDHFDSLASGLDIFD